jgi:hypothetical protein
MCAGRKKRKSKLEEEELYRVFSTKILQLACGVEVEKEINMRKDRCGESRTAQVVV